jgi:hypothetical protein
MTLSDKVPENANQKAFICKKSFKNKRMLHLSCRLWVPLNNNNPLKEISLTD